MPLDRVTAAGAVLAVIAALSVVAFLAGDPFQPFEYAHPPDRFIGISQDVGAEDSRFMWSFRVTDLLAQAFVIFAASLACLAILEAAWREGGQ